MKLAIEQLQHWETTTPNKTFLRQPFKGQWSELSYAEVAQEVRKLAHAIQQQNLPPQSKIALLSKNCSHWIITDLAILMSGHVSVPLYPTLNATSIDKILTHSEARLLFVGKLDNWKKQSTGLTSTIPKVSYPLWPQDNTTTWDDFTKNADGNTANATKRSPDELATLIYTSGTSGDPKGVMISFANMAFAGTEAQDQLNLTSGDRFFSYLPLSHVAERMLVQTCCLYAGATISFAESLESFAKNLKEVNPTVFLSVPRIWGKFQQGILKKMPQKKLSLLSKIPVIRKIVQNKIKAQLGLAHTKHALTGAAPISVELLKWYKKYVGIHIEQGYGMTENFAYSHVAFEGKSAFGSVGPNLRGVDCKIAPESNEILIASKATMMGYYKNPEETAKSLDNGYLKTGDQGKIDENGNVFITGRVKDLFKTSKGKYVAPTPIELQLQESEHIEQVCLFGSGIPQPLAIITLSEESKKSNSDVVKQELKQLLRTTNTTLESYERISSIVIVKDDWSIDNGLLTPTLKIKRNIVEAKYKDQIEDFAEKRGVIEM